MSRQCKRPRQQCDRCGAEYQPLTDTRRFCGAACARAHSSETNRRPSTIEVRGDEAAIHLRVKGEHIRVPIDPDDAMLVAGWTWRASRKSGQWRVVGRRAGSKVSHYLSRVIMADPPGLFVDHINGDTLDNRRGNLRAVEPRANSQNHMHGYGERSLPRGVGIVRRNNGRNVYFRVEHKLNGKHAPGGYFKTLAEADAAAKKWRAEHMPFSAEGDGRVIT
jgi:hypothetical protein